jgi:hypothetical protein
MKQKTLKERIQYISFLHKQNLNGRETEDELFEAGIEAGIEEEEEDRNEFAIGFGEWISNNRNNLKAHQTEILWHHCSIEMWITTKELLQIYKKEKEL